MHNSAPLRHLLVLALSVVATACTSTKIIARQELSPPSSSNASRLSMLSVGFVAAADDARNRADLESFVVAVGQTKIFKKVALSTPQDTWPDILVLNFRDEHPIIGQGFQCFEPYLLVVSAGLVPAVCKVQHHVSFELVARATTSMVQVTDTYTEKSAWGWFAPLYTPSEPGQFSGSFAEYVRALFEAYTQCIEPPPVSSNPSFKRTCLRQAA